MIDTNTPKKEFQITLCRCYIYSFFPQKSIRFPPTKDMNSKFLLVCRDKRIPVETCNTADCELNIM